MGHDRITTTIGALVEAEATLGRVAAVRLPAKTRYHVVKLAKLVGEEVREHYHEPRLAIFRELGTEQSGSIQVPPEQLPELQRRVIELGAVVVTIPWGPITSTMLEPVEDVTGADMLALGPLFVLVETESVP